ncbi:hypothetical protein ACFWIY_19140 [Streptomyces sioyaensis]
MLSRIEGRGLLGVAHQLRQLLLEVIHEILLHHTDSMTTALVG